MNYKKTRCRRLCMMLVCNAEQIKQFMKLFKQRRVKEEMKMLSEHRAVVLAQLHVYQDELYCIDYMAHNLEKEL